MVTVKSVTLALKRLSGGINNQSIQSMFLVVDRDYLFPVTGHFT
jgi:hypothetical protein